MYDDHHVRPPLKLRRRPTVEDDADKAHAPSPSTPPRLPKPFYQARLLKPLNAYQHARSTLKLTSSAANEAARACSREETRCRINTVNIWDRRNVEQWKPDGWSWIPRALSTQSHRPTPTDILVDGCDRRRTSLAAGVLATCLPSLTNISAISERLVRRDPADPALRNRRMTLRTTPTNSATGRRAGMVPGVG
ncbi:hypothetical protein C8F01DRAFT_1079565 [Mycena amicta]|nr:hypothetical protein C8F01DRAFT_1079565 [Mycena amicta]